MSFQRDSLGIGEFYGIYDYYFILMICCVRKNQMGPMKTLQGRM